MENFRTTNKKQLAARVLCGLLLGMYFVGGYGQPVAWSASANNASVNVTEDSSGDASSAWGDSTTASGIASTAFGIGTLARGDYSTAFGDTNTAWNTASTAFGHNTKADGVASTAFGEETTAASEASTAFGVETIAGGYASTAFGFQSKTDASGATAWGGYYDGYVKGGTASGKASTAFGEKTTASGEASTAFGDSTEASGYASTAFGDSTEASGYASTAWGNKSVAGGNYSTAFGDASQALAENSLAALGGIVEKDAKNGLAIGKGATVSSADSIALGNKSVVKNGSSGFGLAIGKDNEVSGANSIAIGTGLKVSGKNSGAFGDPSIVNGDNSYSVGNNNEVTGSNTFVFGNNVKTGAKNAVVLGDGSEGVDNAVSVGAKGKERQIKNVAPGTDDSDATTVKQVKEMIEAGGGGADLAPINRRIDNVDSKINKVGAGAAALAALHPMDTDGKFSMAAGFGNYRDANAMALGVFYRPNDQVMFSMGGSLGNGENLLNVGVSFALDKGVNTSKAAMAKKIASLTEENAQQAAKIETLEARLAALEAKLGK